MTRWLLRGGSMKPFFWPGDMLLVEKVDADQVRWGQVVVFLSRSRPGRHVAHRVLSTRMVGGKRVIVTRGDNGSAPDPPLYAEAILGRITGRWRDGKVLPVTRSEEGFAWLLSRGAAWTQRQHPHMFWAMRKMGATVMSGLLKPRTGIVFRQEGEEGLLFLPETGEVKLHNETGAMIWQMLEESSDRDTIIQRLTDAFDSPDRTSLEADVDAFLEQVRRSQLLTGEESTEEGPVGGSLNRPACSGISRPGSHCGG